MKRLTLAFFLLCAAPGFGAIAYVANGSGTCVQNTTTTHTCDIAITGSSNSHQEIVACAIHVTSVAVTSIADSGSSYSLITSISKATDVKLEYWATGITGSVASTIITVTVNGDTDFTCAAGEYSGILAQGVIAFSTSGSSSTSTAPISATSDNNNWFVGGYAVTGANTVTANAGNLRQNASSSNATVALVDNTAASAGSIINTRINLSPNATSARGGIELRTVAPSGGVRHRSSQS